MALQCPRCRRVLTAADIEEKKACPSCMLKFDDMVEPVPERMPAEVIPPAVRVEIRRRCLRGLVLWVFGCLVVVGDIALSARRAEFLLLPLAIVPVLGFLSARSFTRHPLATYCLGLALALSMFVAAEAISFAVSLVFSVTHR